VNFGQKKFLTVVYSAMRVDGEEGEHHISYLDFEGTKKTTTDTDEVYRQDEKII